MGARFAWATPEYLLWRMTIGQVMMYLQYATEKPEPEGNNRAVKPVSEMTEEEALAWREDIRRQFGKGAIDG